MSITTIKPQSGKNVRLASEVHENLVSVTRKDQTFSDSINEKIEFWRRRNKEV